MNITHFKYAIEIAKTKSINKAADNLFISQPNLSRAIKELEERLGAKIFKRTAKGISVTHQGEAFLKYAQNIVHQFDYLETIFKKEKPTPSPLTLSVPSDFYIAYGFVEFTKKFQDLNISYQETNIAETLENVLNQKATLGIIRYPKIEHDKYQANDQLALEILHKFHYQVLVDKSSPLAQKKFLRAHDLNGLMEVGFKQEAAITITDRANIFMLLQNVVNTYSFVAHVPKALLDKYYLTMIPYISNDDEYYDSIIYLKDHLLPEIAELFIMEVSLAIKH